jgi:uncharacterized protein (DUF58 family)
MRALTGAGRVVTVVTLLLIASGWVANYPELVALGLAGAFTLAAAAVWMLRRPDLVIERSIRPTRVEQYTPAYGALELTNVGRRRSPPVLAVEHAGSQAITVPLPSLGRGATYTTGYALDTSRRGIHAVGPLTVGHSDPLRLLYAGRDYASTSRLWVHPRVHAIAPVPMGRSRDMEGPTSSSAPQGGIAFHSLREYEPGDDLRLIHWPSTARSGTLMVRHNVVPNLSRVTVILDTSSAPYADDAFEDAVRVAASLCVTTLEHGFPLELRSTSGTELALPERPGAGEAAVLDMLTAAEASDDDDGLAALTTMVVLDRETSLVVVTGQPSPEQLSAVSRVRDRYSAIRVVTIGDPEQTPRSDVPAINARTSEDFAATWNRMVQR